MGEKFLQLQQQMRHDNEDLQDYLRDLKNWEKDIKRKDEALRQEKLPEEKVLPPIRNQRKRNSKETKHKSKVKQSQSKQHVHYGQSRIGGYDYRSWDKFDVDKACADLDSDEEGQSLTAQVEGGSVMGSGTDSEEERELNRQQLIQQANMEKEKGNALFKQGKFDDAIVCYTSAIEADPANAILPANRAMARLKLKRFEEAVKDCDSSIALDCTYIKAYARRGAARFGLGRLTEAKKDYLQVLNLEPSNKQAALELKRIDKIIQQEDETERQKQVGEYNVIQAVNKPVHLRSKKPLKRMVIEEIGSGNVESEDESSQRQTKENSLPQTTCNHSIDSGHLPMLSSTTQNHVDSATPNERIETCEGSTDQVRVLDLAKTSVPATDLSVQLETSSWRSIPQPPVSSYQLLAEWRKLETFPKELFLYFKRIPPASYKQLLQQSLDSSLLMKILILLRDQYIRNNEPIFETLKGLTQVKRFEMNVMFMSSSDQEVVHELFSHMEKSDTKSLQELSKLRKHYQL